MKKETQLWISFFFMGTATLLPWNFFITPFEYWMTKLQRSDWANATKVAVESTTRSMMMNLTVAVDKETRQMPMVDDISDAAGCASSPFEFNDLQKFWMSSLGISTMITNLIFCFVTAILAKKISQDVRFIGCLIGYFVCLSATLVMVKMDSEEWIPSFFTSTLVIVVVITICCGIFQTSTFGLASVFPGELNLIVAVMSGQGFGGIFASVLNLITLSAFESPVDAAFVFFLLAIIYTAFALYLFCSMRKNELYLTYVNKLPEQAAVATSPSSREEETKLMSKEGVKTGDDDLEKITFGKFIQTTLWPYMLSVFLVFAVTLGLFPGAAAFIKPANYDCTNLYHTKYFVPIWCFTLYNVTDTIGRWAAGKIDFPKVGEATKLLTLCIARISLLVLFPMTNIDIQDRNTQIYFKSDLMYILLMSVIGLTGGFLGSKAMGAGQLAPAHLQDDTGNLMGTCLVAGLLGGASLSFGVLALI